MSTTQHVQQMIKPDDDGDDDGQRAFHYQCWKISAITMQSTFVEQKAGEKLAFANNIF